MASGDDVYQGLLARGVSPIAAAALAGNAQQESSFNPTAWNAKSGAGGLFQWRLDRLAGLENYAKATNRPIGDLDTQLDYAVSELKGPEAKAYQAINAATDVPSANAAVQKYLRYAPNEGGSRLRYSLAFAGKPMAQTDTTSQDLEGIFGGNAGASPAASADVSAGLDAIFGPETNPFGTTSKPGTPQYVKDAAAFLKGGGKKPAANPEEHPELAVPADVVPDWMRAFSANAVEGVPVVGAFARGARNALIGPAAESQMEALENQARASSPAAATAGSIFGTVAPLAAAGTTAVGARLLGMTGSLPGRALMGAASGGVLSGADSFARGDSPQQAATNALIGGAVGGVAPVALGLPFAAARNAFMGPSAEAMANAAMKADQIAPSATNQLLGQMGPGALPADLGPNAQHLAGALATLPGEPQTIIRNALTGRAADAGARLGADVANNLGVGQPIGQLTSQIIAAQKAAAAPLYAAVDNVGVNMTPALKALQATPLGKQAFQTAATMMANDGKAGTGTTVGFLDAAKQALDDVASSNLRAGNNNAARQASQMAATLRSEVDAQVPQYAAARDAFAGPAAVLEAVQQGQELFTRKMSPEDLKTALTGMSQSEKDGLLQGAQAAVQQMIGDARTDAAGVKSLFQSSNAKEKLALLIGPDQANAISSALDREAAFARTGNVAAGNSETAARMSAQRAVNPDLAAMSGPQRPQTWQGIALAALDKARGALTSSYRDAQNVKLANMLTSPAWSPATMSRVANPGNALLAPAAASLGITRSDLPQNALTWARPALEAAAIPRVIVNGAQAISQ